MGCVAWQPLPLQHHFCHTHTTVTVIGGTAKQLLGSSTDWCATTIVTPHTRGATSHTHTWMAKWCGVANVLRLLCASTLAWSLHFATPFVCVTSSAKCVSPSIPSPLCFSITHPFFWCMWHCQVAFTFSLWILVHWCWHLCPSFGAHHASHPPLPVCGDGVPALPWPCQPLATFLVCFLVCSSSHCFNLH